MATLSIDRRSGKNAGYNIQWYEDKKRYTIHLGGKQYAKRTAERLKDVIESLLYYRRNGITIPERPIEEWLKNAPKALQAKLAKVGLIVLPERKTCQMLWDTFLKYKTDIKPVTVRNYQACREMFLESFLPNEPIESITSDRLLAWKAALLVKSAPASVTLYLTLVRAVLNWAVRQEWFTKSPMVGIPAGSFENRDKDRIITMEEYGKLLAACPNQEWRVIIALARIGGLRCPSELQQLRWSDVDWKQNRFLVKSPKTERHAGRGERLVPLFPELRVELVQHFVAGVEFIIQSKRCRNLRDPFQKIADLAGLDVIVRPFDNMRMSRSNEVLRRWGAQKESLWIGHTGKVMEKHYFRLDDEDFAEASR